MKYRLIYWIFFFTITNNLIAQTKGIRFDRENIDFGEVQKWLNNQAVFTFTNNTSAAIRVLPIRAAFDLEVRYPRELIQPGQSAKIVAIYYTDRSEFFLRKFPIYFSHAAEPTVLKIEGKIMSLHKDAFIACPNTTEPKKEEVNKDLILNVQIIDDETSLPVKNSNVSFAISSKEIYSFKTDVIGAFQARIKYGQYQLFTRASGYETNVDMKNLDPSTTFIQVRLKPLKKETPPIASNTNTQNPISETKTDTPILANTSSQKEIMQGRDTVIVEKYKRDTVYFNLKTDEEIKKEEDLQKLLNEAQQKLTQMEAEIKQVKEREMQVKEQRELELRKQEEMQAALKKQPINEIDTKTGMLNQELFKLNNIVFLLDVSGSMIEGGKLILMQNNLKKLIQVLRPEDQISIITYNINAYETLPVTKVNNKFLINKTIDSLKASGLTNGVKGLEKAYQFLEQHFITNGNNQVIMITDGKFTKTKDEEGKIFSFVNLKSMNAMKLTVVGLGNDRDANKRMKKLAESGNGNLISIENTMSAADNFLLEEIKGNSRK